MTTTIEHAKILERTIKYKYNETDEFCTGSLHVKPTEIQCKEAAQRLRELDKPKLFVALTEEQLSDAYEEWFLKSHLSNWHTRLQELIAEKNGLVFVRTVRDVQAFGQERTAA